MLTLGAAAMVIPYQFSGLAEATLLASGPYVYEKTGSASQALIAQPLTSLVIEGSMGLAMLGAMSRFPRGIQAYAHSRSQAQRRGKAGDLPSGVAYVTWAAFMGTPGVETDSLLRDPDKGLKTHAKRGAIATGAISAWNGVVGAAIIGAITGGSLLAEHANVEKWADNTLELLTKPYTVPAVIGGIALYKGIKVAKTFDNTKHKLRQMFARKPQKA